jgi:hypothetical protein
VSPADAALVNGAAAGHLLNQTVEHSVQILGQRHPITTNAKVGKRLNCDLEPQPI